MNAAGFYDLAYFEAFLEWMRRRPLERLDNRAKTAALIKQTG